ncbi:hypothetical protein AcV5_005858 [Taiwanofungus camphoratus]|nr:hypothetical protein AcV5_005858 [Antrodia cinnamomea]
MVLLLLLALSLYLGLTSIMADNVQSVFDASSSWRVSMSNDWDVLGPFPIQAREQHFLSPSFPLNLSEPIDLHARYPSSYADGGSVGWSTARSNAADTLEVSFPNIRWASLRATEGWAALQHHTVLRTKITLYPPSAPALLPNKGPCLLVDLLRGSFFTILPTQTDAPVEPVVPEWYAGNIYSMGRVPAQSVSLPVQPSDKAPTTYDLFVSGDYEIRLFGDPRFSSRTGDVPVLSVTLGVAIEQEPQVQVSRVPSHDISCDFVDGWAFGDALGFGIRSVSDQWWTVKDVVLADSPSKNASIALSLVNETRLAPTQTRIVAIRIIQNGPFHKDEIVFDVHLMSGNSSITLHVSLPIKQHGQWPTSIKASYFFATSMPTSFLVVPPEEQNSGEPRPPILALHGAGVDIFEAPFWIEALPRQKRSWLIAPTGRTAWGLDWHGPSTQDAWGSVDALYMILKSQESWHPWMLVENTRVLVLGHSNGGQGVWYIASRYPDRVVAAIPAAGYIKSQSYVPLTQSRSAHYLDPSLRAILESSLTADDNDLFLSNLVDTPILAIHGGDDENVPVWHTREAVSVLKTWDPQTNVTYLEDSGEPHWYPSVFLNDHVQGFIRDTIDRESGLQPAQIGSGSFTLTVSIPSESGSLHGWQIHSLLVPGRLARLTVHINDGSIVVRTVNVEIFSVRHSFLRQCEKLVIDSSALSLHHNNRNDFASFHFSHHKGYWKLLSSDREFCHQPSGRMSRILASTGPLVIVIADKRPSPAFSAALRIAHNLNAYHKLDVDIIDDLEAVGRLTNKMLGVGNIVVLGSADSAFSQRILRDKKTAFTLENHSIYLNGQAIRTPSTATLFLHPHPHSSTALMLFIHSLNDQVLERAIRLFPIRTGVPSPDWIMVDAHADIVGSGAVEGAGVWGNNWNWSTAMSSFYIIM